MKLTEVIIVFTQVGSNGLSFTAWQHKERNKDRDRKIALSMNTGGFMIAVRKYSFIDSKQNSLEPT